MIRKRVNLSKTAVRAFTICIPAALLIGASSFNLLPVTRQLLVGVMLIWFHVSLMLGVWI